MTWRTFARLVLVGVLGSAASSCSGSDDETVFDGIVIELSPLGPIGWTAADRLVDGGHMCTGGEFHHTAYLDLDGSPLSPAEGWERKIEAIFAVPEAPATYREVLQHVCADGSGSFTVVYTLGSDEKSWVVIDGTGAYGGLRASGTQEMELEPAPHPDGPPRGLPVRNALTGTVEFASAG